MKYNVSKTREVVALKARPGKKGGSALYLEYSAAGKRVRESLKLYLVPEKTPLDKIQNQETLKTANAIKAKRIVDMQNGKAGFVVKQKRVRLSDYITQREDYYASRGSASTAQGCRELRRRCIEYGGDKVMLSDVNKEYVLGFIKYLENGKWLNVSKKKDKRGKGRQDLKQGTKSRMFRMFNIVLNAALREELIIVNPSQQLPASIKPMQGESTREYLTMDELRKLAKTPTPDLVMRDTFLFACFTGLRVSDVIALDWTDIIDDGQGGLQIRLTQKKTQHSVIIPLGANAMRYLPESKESGKVFEGLTKSRQLTVCRHLKEWAKDAGIKKNITFHVARHTNATMLLTYGADIYTVSQLLGHYSVKTTQVYAKIVNEKRRKAVDLIPSL